jgi:hypothetical protein
MGIDMKDAEDEAFEEIERRQGGFQAKRQMAANKVQESSCRPIPKAEVLDTLVDLMNQAAQPAQEPVVQPAPGYCKNCNDYTIEEPLYAQPAQKQWNAALDEAASRIGEIKGFGQATQDSFAVYIKGLKK